MKTVLDLEGSEVKDFFLMENSYFNLDLPYYFTFEKLLKTLDKKLNSYDSNEIYSCPKHKMGIPLILFHKSVRPNKLSELDGANYKILNNKDGKYAWRPFQLIHPVIYVSLVHIVTKKEHWETIKNRFKEFKKNTNIECHSVPDLPDEGKSQKKAKFTNGFI